MVKELFPTIQTTLLDSEIATAMVAKTVLKKAFLIHEMFSVEGGGHIADRKSRHLYDLSCMMDENFALEAIKDYNLWESIRRHREVFTSINGMDYTPDIREPWKADYAIMCASMIFGEKPSFEELLLRMKELEDRFHNL